MDKTKRRSIIAGNWKMNMTRKQASELGEKIVQSLKDVDCDVVLCVPFTDLETVGRTIKNSNILLGAQNCHWAPSGAFTGEISAEMLAELGVKYVVIGHSERRQFFGETDKTVNQRLKAVVSQGLSAIVCVGETLDQRESGKTTAVIRDQVVSALEGLTKDELKNIVIAYEPIWAIGTGKTASAEEAGEACAFIRGILTGLFGEESAYNTRIQYGGSMNENNAALLLEQYDIDGGLIGGASLKAESFAAIVLAATC